jgi:hypothetical protein
VTSNTGGYSGPFAIYIESKTQVEFTAVEDARQAEWTAIKTEFPVFNVLGGTRGSLAAKAFMADPVNIEIRRDSWRRQGMDDAAIARVERLIHAAA